MTNIENTFDNYNKKTRKIRKIQKKKLLTPLFVVVIRGFFSTFAAVIDITRHINSTHYVEVDGYDEEFVDN
ncbi:hypothetical protein [Segatella albensis]|uniref:hypothetical protein n=1 Tax=Segatella albensis TaxID=77768 RepID=UPI00138AC503|nr:hypothetical protein [Segatella albensis]